MTNFTTVVDEVNQVETMVEEGFDQAVVVQVDHQWDNEWTYIRKTFVPSEEVKAVYNLCAKGAYNVCVKWAVAPCEDLEWLLHTSYYWLVKRTNGKMYPFPLLFAGRKERLASASQYNDYTWGAFYEGRISSSQLEEQLVDCPSEEEITALLVQLDQLTDNDGSQWDDLDARGGLVPRWAA